MTYYNKEETRTKNHICSPDKEVEETDLLTIKTPFHLDDGWELVIENKNCSCSHAEIDQLIQKRIVSLIDIEIMKILATFHYVNHYHIAYLLKDRLHIRYQKISYLDNLNKLKRAGIILCHIFADADAKLSAEMMPASPLRLYSLSQAAFSYMASITSDAHAMTAADTLRKIEMAASNQFLIHFLHHYQEQIKAVEYSKNIKLGTSVLSLNAVISFYLVFPGTPKTNLITMPILAIRDCENWEKTALSRIHLLSVWLARNKEKYPIPFPIVLIENLSMALKLYSMLPQEEGQMPLYFCTESLLMVYPPLAAIFRCEMDENDNIKVVRIEIEL